MRRFLLPALVLGLVGCGGDAEPEGGLPVTEPPAGTAPAETRDGDEAGLAQTCSNQRAGFTVDYPEGWHTNDPNGVASCTFFHPEPFELPEASEPVGIAIRIDRESVPFTQVVGESTAQEVTSREELQVAGRPAVRIEFRATGEGLLDRGTRGTMYAVNLERATLVATTLDVDGLDYERNAEVLGAMMESLTLD